MNQAQLPAPGALIDGKYVIDRLLGQGGMGAVFAAKHRTLGHAVAIKVMLADSSNQEASQRFVNEGRAAAHIQNDHVVRVSDVGTELGYAYMVLELLEGEDLSQVLERRLRLPVHEAASYVIQALKGVAEAHALGIIHRDLKPANMFLAKKRDGSSVVKILDFGISKAHGAQAQLGVSPGQLTSTKAMLGSPLYMSPEQLRSSKSVDSRADIWAMGVILFELTTGTLPFNGDSLGELFAAILESEVPNARSVVPDLPHGFEHVVMKCLEKRADNRFAQASDLISALTPYATAQATPYLMSTVALGQGGPPSGHATGPGRPGSDPALGPGASKVITGSGLGQPAFGATTGSGANIPVVKGFGGTGDPSQSVNWKAPAATSPAKTAVIVAAVAVLGLAMVGGVGATLVRRSSAGGAGGAGGPASAGGSGSTPEATLHPTATAAPTASVQAAASAPTATAVAPAEPPAAAKPVVTPVATSRRPTPTPTTAATPTPTAKPTPPKPPVGLGAGLDSR